MKTYANNLDAKLKGTIFTLIQKHQHFIKFVIVGIINTINYYCIYLALLFIGASYITSHSLAFLISMIGSFYLNCYFTYKTKPSLKKFLQFPLTYVINYTITTLSLFIFVDLLHMGLLVAPIISSILPIPFTFIVSKWILNK